MQTLLPLQTFPATPPFPCKPCSRTEPGLHGWRRVCGANRAFAINRAFRVGLALRLSLALGVGPAFASPLLSASASGPLSGRTQCAPALLGRDAQRAQRGGLHQPAPHHVPGSRPGHVLITSPVTGGKGCEGWRGREGVRERRRGRSIRGTRSRRQGQLVGGASFYGTGLRASRALPVRVFLLMAECMVPC